MKKLIFIIFFLIFSSNVNAGCDDPITDGVDYTKCKFSDGQDLQGSYLPNSNPVSYTHLTLPTIYSV